MANASGARPRVLVVEDDLDARAIYEGTLHHAGYEVTTAGSLAEATRAARAHRPRLVVLDSRLPDGHGIELLRTWKRCAEMSAVPVLMVTAFSRERDVQAAALAGADAFIVKPCYGSTLTTHLSHFLAMSAPTRHVARSPGSRPRVQLTLADRFEQAPGTLYPLGDGKLEARCSSCLRGSPVLGRQADDAEKQAIRLGWSLRRNSWLCPVCIERQRLPRSPSAAKQTRRSPPRGSPRSSATPTRTPTRTSVVEQATSTFVDPHSKGRRRAP